MDLGIKGKRALVIGGSTGLGLASAEALAAEGVDIAIFARNSGRLQTAVDHIKSYGVQAAGHVGDITRQEDVRGLRDWIAGTGGLDILVLNTPRPPSRRGRLK